MAILARSTPALATGGGTVAGTVSAVGPYVTSEAVKSVDIVTQHPGDLVVAMAALIANHSTPGVITAVGSTGDTGWAPLFPLTNMSPSGTGYSMQAWIGNVVTAGDDTITMQTTGDLNDYTLNVQQFTAGLGPTTLWAIDGVQSSAAAHASSATLAYPSLTPSGVDELYFGYAFPANVGVAGSSPGFVYDDDDAFGALMTYNVNVDAVSAPTGIQAPAGIYLSGGALIKATGNAGSVITSATLQLAEVPSGLEWLIYQIGYEVVTSLPVEPDSVSVVVTLNGRLMYANANGASGTNQGPPYIRWHSGDILTITWTGAPVTASCVANIYYNEYISGQAIGIPGAV